MRTELNWREVWERKHEERVETSLKGKLKPEDWGKVAKDYSIDQQVRITAAVVWWKTPLL